MATNLPPGADVILRAFVGVAQRAMNNAVESVLEDVGDLAKEVDERTKRAQDTLRRHRAKKKKAT